MMKPFFLTVVSTILFVGLSFAQVKHSTHRKKNRKTARVEYGTASFYHNKFIGRETANGEIFSQKKLTAAHNKLPFGTWIRVTNLRNKRSVVVKVNDRLKWDNKRIVDLSAAAAKRLGVKTNRLLSVKVEVLGKRKPVLHKKTTQ